MARSNDTRSPVSMVSKFLIRPAAVGLALLTPALASTAEARDVRIIGGQTESRWPAVGALLGEGEWFCSGTVIAPRVVLTAAHCLEGMAASDLELFIGPDANRPESGKRIRVAGAYVHPNYASDDNQDIGVMVLAEDAGVTPIPARLSPLTDDIVGKNATFVGYGLIAAEADGGEKRSVEIAISELNDWFVGYATPGRNTCNGDSGGPALMDLGRGLEVVGVTSWGDEACTDFGYNTRSDVFADWIGEFVAGGIPASSEVPQTGGTSSDGGSDWTDDGGGTDGGGGTDDGGDWTDDGGGSNGSDGADGGTGGADGGDICAEMDWYGDDYCDEDCARPDPDCGEGGGTVSDDDGWSGDDGSDEGDNSDAGGDVGAERPEVGEPAGLGCGAGPGAMWALLGGLGLVLARGSLRLGRRG